MIRPRRPFVSMAHRIEDPDAPITRREELEIALLAVLIVLCILLAAIVLPERQPPMRP